MSIRDINLTSYDYRHVINKRVETTRQRNRLANHDKPAFNES